MFPPGQRPESKFVKVVYGIIEESVIGLAKGDTRSLDLRPKPETLNPKPNLICATQGLLKISSLRQHPDYMRASTVPPA